MNQQQYLEDPDVVLIGAGIMSANLGALLKRLDPGLKIQLFEVTDKLAQEASHGWHNAGTGHAGICELSYTPDQAEDGSVNVSKAIHIFHQFEHTRQFWAHTIADGMIENPREFINAVPHISFVYGKRYGEFLQARFEGLSRHYFFRDMEFTTDPETIRRWTPLLMEGRENMPVAATKIDAGTDVNFGAVARKLLNWLGEQPDCAIAAGHRVIDLQRVGDRWNVIAKDLKTGRQVIRKTRFVFVGAGGGCLSLLQKSGIPEISGYGGFPIGGQWLVCDKPAIVERHQAKVYGHAQDEAPTMAVPHLDTRVIDGKKWLLFGPFAAWTTRFLRYGGSWADLPSSMKLGNIGTLMNVGLKNMPLVRYMIQQGTQSMPARLDQLRRFYPNANAEDWRLIDAGIRVQAIKQEDGQAGIIHYGTEVLASADRTICALLGASPGASVSVDIMLEVIEKCMPQLLREEPGRDIIKQLVPTYGQDFLPDDAADRFWELSQKASKLLQLAC